MAQIYDQLKALISPEMISKASSYLGESDSKVSSAVSAIIPTFLGSLLRKGDTPQIKNTLKEAGRSNILSNAGSLFSGNTTAEQQSVADKFMHALWGDKTGEYTSALASHTGLSGANNSKLTALLSALTAGFLGNQLVHNNYSLSGLLSQLGKEKGSFIGMIPSNLKNKYDMNTKDTRREDHEKNIPVKGKKNNSWLTWVILILLLLLLLFW